MTLRQSAFRTLAALLLLPTLYLAANAEDVAPTLIVSDDDHDYPTIQAAIDDAPEGATILVRAGSYRENLLISQPLTLEGEEGASIAARYSDVPTIWIDNTELVEIRGLTIRDGQDSPAAISDRLIEPAFKVIDSNCVIERCTIESVAAQFARAIWIVSLDFLGPISTHASIRDCTIRGVASGIRVASELPYNVEISGCTIQGDRFGVSIDTLGQVLIVDSTFSDLDIAINCPSAESLLVEDCAIHSCGTGISLADIAETSLIGNSISCCQESGLQLSPATGGNPVPKAFTLRDNVIEGNGLWGISQCDEFGEIEGDFDAEIELTFRGTNNTIRDNDAGVYCPDGLIFPDGFFVDD